MQINRRRAVSAIAGAAFAARGAFGQTGSGSRTARPSLCAYSGNLARIPYPELPEIVKAIGFDGVDLTVMPGGHVDPSMYRVDLDRAFQEFQSANLDLPMVTTDFTSASQPLAYAIMYVSASLGARFCRLGTWPAPDPDPTGRMTVPRAIAMRNELAQFAATGLHCKITPMLANHAGSFPGRSIPEAEALLAGIDRVAFGYCFDPVQAVIEAKSAEGWEPALRAALPRLAAVALSDVALDKDPGASPRPCPLGEGVIDWKKFFSMLAAARFSGPVSMHMDYKTGNGANSMTKDLAFARDRVEEAWPG